MNVEGLTENCLGSPSTKIRTAKTQYRKFETNIPRKGVVRPQSQIPQSCSCVRFIYYHDRSAFSAAGNMWTDPGNICINRSQTHNVEIGTEAAQFPEKEYINGCFVAGRKCEDFQRKKRKIRRGEKNAVLRFYQLPKEGDAHCCIERRTMQALERNVIGKDMLCTMILLRKPGIRPCEQE